MKYCLLFLLFTLQIACSRQKPNFALLVAASSDDVEGVEKALRDGADINSTTADGKTPLMHAAMMGSGNAVHFLVQKKAELNHQDRSGRTALMYALAGDSKIAIELIRAGADVSIKDELGTTALMNTTDPQVKELIKKAGGKEINWVLPSRKRSSMDEFALWFSVVVVVLGGLGYVLYRIRNR